MRIIGVGMQKTDADGANAPRAKIPRGFANARLIERAQFMTAKVQPAEIKEYMDMGALGVIVKPFDPMTVARQITSLWEGRNV